MLGKNSNFVRPVKALQRKRLIFGALFTEVCLAYPVVEALKDGYEVMFVEVMVGGQSLLT